MFVRARPVPFVATLAAAVVCSLAPAFADVKPSAARYAVALGTAQPELSRERRVQVAERVTLLSSYYRLDPALLMALVSVESAWHPLAQSPVGALGLGQLMPDTAAALDVLPLRVDENLDGAARYLRRMLDRFGASERLALAAYNAGPAVVARFHDVPPFRETRAYVLSVLRLRAQISDAAAPRVPVAHERRANPPAHSVQRAAHTPSAAALAYLAAPDPNGVSFADLATPAPAAVAVKPHADASTSIVRRLFGRHGAGT